MLECQICGHFKDGVLEACDEVSEKTRGRRHKGDIIGGGMKR